MIIAIAAAAGLGGVVVKRWHSGRQKSGETDSSQVVQTPQGQSAGNDQDRGSPASCTTKLTVVFSTQDTSEAAGLTPTPIRSFDATHGSFTLLPIAQDTHGWLAKVEFTAASDNPAPQAGAVLPRRPATRLNNQVLYAAFNASGLLDAVYAAGGASSAQRSDSDSGKLLLTRWQFKLPAERSQAYGAAEADLLGLASTHYEWTSQSEIIKQKTVYIRTWGNGPKPTIVASRITAEIGRQGLERLEGDEAYQIAVAEFKSNVRSRWQQAVNSRVPQEPTAIAQCLAQSPLQLIKAMGLKDLGIGPNLDSATTIGQDRQKYLEGRSVSTLIAELEKHQHGKDDLQASAPVVRDLIDRLTVWPQDSDTVRDTVIKRTVQNDLAKTLIGALASVATTEAQAALLDIMRDKQERGDLELWHFTMRSHILTPAPSGRNVEYLLDLHRRDENKETSKVALLAASAAASNLRGDDQSHYTQQVLALKDSTGSERPELFAAALGNLASRDAIPALQAMIVGDRGAVAATAVDSLASVPGHDIDRLLLSMALTKSKSDTFRIRALMALKSRALEEDVVKDLIAFCQKSTDLDLQKATLTVLVGEQNRFWPAASTYVHQLAASPQTPDALRATIKDGL